MRLQDFSKRHESCVYCLDFPNGKHYVGKCHDLGKRLHLYESCVNGLGAKGGRVVEALREFGFDAVGIRVLSEVSCSDKVDRELCLSLLEIKYIREIGSLYPNGYNVSLGGEVLGVPVEYLTTDEAVIKSLTGSSKVILEYGLDGKFIKEYSSISRYAYERGFDEDSIRASVNKRTPYYGKYYLRSKRYDVIPDSIEVEECQVRERIKFKDVIQERVIVRDKIVAKGHPVIVYDVNGDFVGEYNSRYDAARNLVTVKSMPWGKYCQGYIVFKKVSDDYPSKIEKQEDFNGKIIEEIYKPVSALRDMPIIVSEVKKKKYRLSNNFPIAQFSLDHNLVTIHSSIRDASETTGIPYSLIYNCVKGQTRTAKGFIWQKAEE